MNCFALVLLSTFIQSPTDLIIDGYVNKLSVRSGDSVSLFLNAAQKSEFYELKLLDIEGKEVSRIVTGVFPQAAKREKPWEGFGYLVTATVKVPPLKSGVYLWEGKVPMVVKASHPKIVVLYSSNTENAYCSSGGKSLYGFNSTDKKMAHHVSFLRPIPLPKHSTDFLKWLNQQQLPEVGYVTDMDMDDYGEIRKASLIIIPGHSEYWTLAARKNFDAFIREGKPALILSGNTMWWQVRYEANKTQLVCYRSAEDDPIKNPKLKTINWNDRKLEYPILNSIGVDFSLGGFGQKQDLGWNGYKVVNGDSPLLQGLGLNTGDILPLSSDEYDGTLVTGFAGRYHPVPDKASLGFDKLEIIGYDSTFRLDKQLMATWIVMKKSKTSGVIINTASTDWCSSRGIWNPSIQQITLTMIQRLLKRENVFSPSPPDVFSY